MHGSQSICMTPKIIEIHEEEGVTHDTPENISTSPSPPSFTFLMDESAPAYIPRAPYPQRLTGSTRKGDTMHDVMELFKKVQINIPLLDAIK